MPTEEGGEENEDGSTEPEPSFVQAKLALELDFNEVAKDPGAKAAFEAQFVTDMAATLGCDPSQLDVQGLEAGSVIVDFKISGGGGGGPDPAALFAALEDKVSSGGLCVAGGAAKGLADVTPKGPSAEELAALKVKQAARRKYLEYAELNAGLATEVGAEGRKPGLPIHPCALSRAADMHVCHFRPRFPDLHLSESSSA